MPPPSLLSHPWPFSLCYPPKVFHLRIEVQRHLGFGHALNLHYLLWSSLPLCRLPPPYARTPGHSPCATLPRSSISRSRSSDISASGALCFWRKFPMSCMGGSTTTGPSPAAGIIGSCGDSEGENSVGGFIPLPSQTPAPTSSPSTAQIHPWLGDHRRPSASHAAESASRPPSSSAPGMAAPLPDGGILLRDRHGHDFFLGLDLWNCSSGSISRPPSKAHFLITSLAQICKQVGKDFLLLHAHFFCGAWFCKSLVHEEQFLSSTDYTCIIEKIST
jgi:hypothetical protein